MGSIFESELSTRFRAGAPGALAIVATGLTIPLLADLPAGWAAWIVLPLVLIPTLINTLSATAAIRDGRDRLFVLLPLPRRQVGLVRTVAPAAFQAAGGAAAVLASLLLAPFDMAALGFIPLILVVTAWLLLAGEAVALYQDFKVRPWGQRLHGAAGGAAVFATVAAAFATALAFIWLVGGTAGRGLVSSAAIVVTFPWDMAAAMISAGLLAALNTELFVSRDVTAM